MQVGEVHKRYIDWLRENKESFVQIKESQIKDKKKDDYSDSSSWENLARYCVEQMIQSLEKATYGSVNELINAIVGAKDEYGTLRCCQRNT